MVGSSKDMNKLLDRLGLSDRAEPYGVVLDTLLPALNAILDRIEKLEDIVEEV